MPVYEYSCDKCGKTTETLRRMNEADDPITCEHCGSRRTKRAHSVFSAQAGTSSPAMPVGGCGNCCGADGSCPYE
jgi:putative FmdB family regulatory protein